MRASVVYVMTTIGPSLAAAQSPTGDLRGVVVEEGGGPLAGATVIVTVSTAAGPRSTRTDAEGRFAVQGLPAGTYDIAAEAADFAVRRQERVVLRAGATVFSRLELRRARLADTIALAPSSPGSDPQRTGPATLISGDEIEFLPLSSRNALDLLLLSSHASASAAGDVRLAGGGEARWAVVADGGRLAIPTGGSLLDRAGARTSPYLLSAGIIQEMEVRGVHTSADWPTPSGIGVVTRSGSNVISGRAFERVRPSGLASRSGDTRVAALDTTMQAHQFGGTVGGPLARDRHFFLASYDGLREGEDRPLFLNVPEGTPPDAVTQAGIARLEAWIASRRVDAGAGTTARRADQDVVFLRTDHALAATRLSARYNDRHFRGVDIAVAGPQELPATGEPSTRTRLFGATLASPLGPSILNEVRFYGMDDRERNTGIPDVPYFEVRQSGNLAFSSGRDPQRPLVRETGTVQISDTVMWSRRGHAARAGFDYLHAAYDIEAAPHLTGSYRFASIASVAGGVPSMPGSYTQSALGDGAASIAAHTRTRRYGVFVQDTWLVTDAVTVTGGIRYQGESFTRDAATSPLPLPAGLRTRPRGGSGAWSPRAGMSWATSGFIVRSAWSLAYGDTPLETAGAAALHAGGVRTFTLDGAGGVPLPAFAARVATVPASALARPALVGFGERYDNERVQQIAAGVEWEWMPNSALALEYVHVRGDRLPLASDLNVGPAAPVTLAIIDEDGTSRSVPYERYAPGPFADLDRVIRIDSSGRSRYNGMNVEVRRRLAQGFQYRLSYTIAKASESGPPPGALTPGTAADRRVLAVPRDATGTTLVPAAADRRHRLIASSVAFTDTMAERFGGPLEALLGGWRVGAIYTLESGSPYSAFVLGDPNGNGNRFDDRAPETRRNEFTRPKSGRLDVRAARGFPLGRVRVTASLDVFNALNATHYRDVETTRFAAVGATLVANPHFGTQTVPLAPRTLQLGVAVSF